jgi:acyl carrier protein
MAEDTLRSEVLQALQEVAPETDADAIDPEVNFRDQCEIDSVDFLNFVLALERRLGVKIPEMDYPRLSSLDGCTRYLGSGAH